VGQQVTATATARHNTTRSYGTHHENKNFPGTSTASTPIEFRSIQNDTKTALATNTWKRFQAGYIHYNGKPNISAASILNKISATDDKEVFLQLGGCV
jgi:hypothetical protein